MKSIIKISMLFLCFAGIYAFSSIPIQTKTINGVVLDVSQSPLVGVSILEKGTKNGTITDINGQFSMDVNGKSPSLVISFVGYETKEIKIGKDSILSIVLDQSTTLDEIVVTGKGSEHEVKKDKSKNGNYQTMPSPSSKVTGYSERQSYVSQPSIANQEMEGGSYDFFKDNAFQSVSKDPLSTLSIDVDRASYANVRRFLNQGVKPPADAVRIEEMINYFNYNYASTSTNKDRPFSTSTTLTTCPWNADHQLLHIGLAANKIDRKNIPTSNLVFLIDVSGSMNSAEKLPLLKSAFRLLVNQLNDEDKVSIVVYAGAAGVVLPPTTGKDKTKILDALDKLEAGGSTAGAQGIQKAYDLATENYVKGGNNRVILATDGDFNVGMSSDDLLTRMIESKRASGIYLSILGFGMGNYKDSKMQKLADAGNGNHAYIDNMQEAKKLLMDEFGSTMFTVANDVKIQIEFNPAIVGSYRMVGYENRALAPEDFNDDAKDAGELGAGHVVTVIYEIIPFGVKSTFSKEIDPLKYQDKKDVVVTSKELGTIKYRYKVPGDKQSIKSEETIKNSLIPWKSLSEDLRWSIGVAEFGMLLRNSPYKAQASYDDVLANIEGDQKKYDVYKSEFINLVQIAKSLE